MTTLLAFDPGKTTGVSRWTYRQNQPLEHKWHRQIEGGLDGFIDFIEYLDDEGFWYDIIVAEQFVLDGRTTNPDVTPLQIEGAICLWRHNEQLAFQRNNFKAHVTNDLLKKHDLYWPGEQHAMDSARHALAYMKVNRHLPTLRKYFSNEEPPE